MTHFVNADRPGARRMATALLLAGVGTAALTLGSSAHAANECGAPPPAGGTVTCTAGTYADGITYAPVADLTVVAPSGVDANDSVSITGADDFRFEGRTGTTIDSADGIGLELRGNTLFGGVASVATTGKYASGIVAQSNADVTIDAGTVTTTGIGSVGIQVTANNSGAVTLDSGTVATAGRYASGILVDSRGTTSVTSTSVTTTGSGSRGIAWRGGNGPVTIDSGSVVTSGVSAVGIQARHYATYYANDKVAGDVPPVSAALVAEDQPLTIISDSIDTSGNYAAGIQVELFGGRRSTTVPVVVTSTDIVTRGNQADGINVDNNKYAEGRINVTSGGAITTSGDDSDGIDVRGGSAIFIDADGISVSGARSVGIRAVIDTKYYGPVNVMRSGPETVDGTPVAQDVAANGGIEIRSDGVTATDTGAPAIRADVFGPGDIDVFITGAVSTTGSYSAGLVAELDSGNRGNAAGDIAIRLDGLGSITTTGDYSRGIVADVDDGNATSGRISITLDGRARISTAGKYSDGIFADSRLFDPADGEAIVTVTNNGRIDTTGEDSDGIRALSSNRVLITSSAVRVTGAGSVGIYGRVQNYGKYYAEAKVAGAPVAAANVAANGGVSITTGAVTANGTGTAAVVGEVEGQGDVDIFVTGAIVTTGDDSPGVYARIDSGRNAYADGDIAIQVTGAGGISTSGKYSHAIVATNESGEGGDIDIDIAAGRTVETSGAEAHGVLLRNFSDGDTTVDVAGTLATALDQEDSFAVYGADGGPVDLTVATGGTLRYKVLLSDFDDTVVNNGTFDSAGISRFRTGDDSFLNAGTLLVRRGATEFGGLELFTNDGNIEMRNGATSDRLTLAGDYVGTGGQLSLDVDFDEETADLLIVGGSATGTTIVNINDGVDFATGFDPIRIVDAGGGSDADAFTLLGGNTDNGFVSFSIEYEGEGDDFYLVPGLGLSALEFSRYAQLNASTWYRSADAVIAQLASGRDVGDGDRPGLGSWVQLLDGRADVESFEDSGGTRFDLSYEQFYTGIQGGLDYTMGGLAIGVTGGVGWSNAAFDITDNRIDSDVTNIGAYLTYRMGGFHADLLAKIDWLDAEVSALGFATDFKAKSYGALLDIGYRFGGDGFWVEPVASIAYVENDIDDIGFGASVAEFDSSHSVRGSAGLRVGGTMQVGNATFVPFLSGRAVDDLEGETVTSFRGTSFSISDDLPGAYGEVGGGASVFVAGFEAFVRGDVQFGIDKDNRDVSGHTMRAGIKLRW